MKKFIALIMTALTCVALAVPAGATFTQYADNEYLCLSTAGYRFNIDDYYNYMKRYNGMTYTTTSYPIRTAGGWCYAGSEIDRAVRRSGMVFSGADYENGVVKKYTCKYDANGTMRLSCSGSNYGWGYWEGLTITASGDVSYTLNDYNYKVNMHYYSLKDEWTYEISDGDTYINVTDKETYGYMSNFWNSSINTIDAFASESMRECYWHYIPYTCYWESIYSNMWINNFGIY